MLNKVYEEVLNFIKGNYKQLIILVIVFIILNFPLNYSIYISGGTINVNDRVEVKDEYKSSGTFNLAYVTELQATAFTYLLSHIVPSWETVPLEEYQASENETMEDISLRSKLYLNKSEEDAIKNAYEKANQTFEIIDTEFNIVYINEIVDSDLKIGDVILEANNEKIKTMEQYKNIINKFNFGDYISLKVKRDNKVVDTKVKVNNINGQKIIGISVLELHNYKTVPEINLSFKKSESGPSGGLMLTLAIYDKLIKEDLTNGYKIVGTGTIDSYGNVGEISGVKYKLRGAVSAGADIFIAPTGDNYQECKSIIKEENYNIRLIEAKTFEQVLNSLVNLD